jgi:riboflavin synthase
MFTGIIEEVGQVVEIADSGGFRTLRVRARTILDDIRNGASISVNGVCLTARSIHEDGFTADLSHETLVRTSLKALVPGAIVNLERPMRADGRFGGHIVQGHVDGMGTIREFVCEGDEYRLEVEFPDSALNYVVEKGSISVDGISLTVARVSPFVLEVAIIPHTFDNTSLKRAKAGDLVNLEFDIIAKYVERILANRSLGKS